MANGRHVLVVMCDINGSPEKKARFVAEVRKARGWWNHIKATWILISDESAEECFDRLSAHVSSPDRLLVLEVTPIAAQGLLNERAWSWLNRNLKI
jgi:hypothetical protein